ncbi:putative cytochrome P450 [Helianthus annuus]|nr:putative cytochrome P450 [Helianthus annuus]
MAVPKLPPGPPKLPIIGNMHQLLGKPRHEALWQLSKEYGPLMQIQIGFKQFLIISSPAMAKRILKTQDHIFCSRSMSHAVERLTYNYLDVAFAPQNDHWREMRKLMVSEFLGPKKAPLFNHVLMTEIESMVRSIELLPSNVAVNLNELFLAIVKGMMCKVAFGNNYRQQPLKGPSWDVMVNEAQGMLGGSLGDNFPGLLGRFIDQLSGWNRKIEKCFANLDAYIDTIIDDHHNQTIAEVSENDKDFVHVLLELSVKDNPSRYHLTKEDVKALIADVILGGVDTTVVTMVWAMSEIARSGRVMQKLQREIRNHIGRKEKVDEADITKMTYLKMVVKETLRLHPPAPLLMPHESLSHCQIDGYDVLPWTIALINAWGMGRDPRIWGENAAEFYPERFENFEVDFEMVPFGGGRRSCPAMNTTLVTVELVLANLLYSFSWEVADGMKNEDLNMQEVGSLVVRKKLPLCLVPTKYSPED